MITSKQRAALRGMANTMQPLYQIGKEGVTPAVTAQLDDALEARELIKLRTLEASDFTARTAADEIAVRVGADVVQVIGTRFILYRQSSKKENRKIVLVK